MRYNTIGENPNKRRVTQAFTPEFIRDGAGLEDREEIHERMTDAVERLEANYPVVAFVHVSSEWKRRGFQVHAFPKRHANADVVKRSMNDLVHWVLEGVDD